MASQVPTSLPSSPDEPRTTWRLLRNIFALLLGGIALICIAAVLARRPVSAWLIERWLAAHDVQSVIAIEDIGLGGAAGRLRLGRPDNPDLTIGRIEFGFAWTGLTPRIASAIADAPALRARYDGQKLDFGQLQNLVGSGGAQPLSQPAIATQTATARPAPPLTIAVRNARLNVETPGGVLHLAGAGDFSNGSLRRLTVAASPATLRLPNATLKIARAIATKEAGDRMHVQIGGAFAGEDAVAALSGATLDADITGLRWDSAAAGIAVSGRLQARMHAGELRSRNASLTGLSAYLDLAGTVNTGGAIDLRGSLRADGEMAQDGAMAVAASVPVLSGFAPARLALAKAMRHPSLAIASFHLKRSAGQTDLSLEQPAQISGGGASLAIGARRGPLVRAKGGVLSGSGEVQFEGPHLPAARLTVTAYRWEHLPDACRFEGTGAIDAHFDYGPVRGGALAARGTMERRGGRLTVALSDCAQVSAETLLSGRKRIARAANAQICGRNGAPLLVAENGTWQLAGLWRGLSLQLTAAQAGLTSPQGEISLQGDRGKLRGYVTTRAAQLIDRAKARRFAALRLAGRATITDNALAGGFTIAGGGRRLGRVALRGTLAHGRADIGIADLAFEPGKLQPRDLSPLLAPIANAKGSANASARVAWSRHGLTSGGEVAIRSLDFTSPAGRIEGARGDIKLASLMPLETAPAQTISADKIAWVTPLTDVTAGFALTPQALELDHAKATLSRGEVALAPVTIPLAGMATQGRIRLDRIDLGELVAASNLAKKVHATGRISGTVPFRYGPDGLSFMDGHVFTVTAASLSIARSMWSGGTGESGSGTSAMQDFAYQALEHLAIDTLEGTVNSTPDGRLSLLLRIKGRSAPTSPREAEVGLLALLQGTAFEEPVPLPAGTEVNLTLDTSLNFAELLAAYRRAWAEGTGRAAP